MAKSPWQCCSQFLGAERVIVSYKEKKRLLQRFVYKRRVVVDARDAGAKSDRKNARPLLYRRVE